MEVRAGGDDRAQDAQDKMALADGLRKKGD